MRRGPSNSWPRWLGNKQGSLGLSRSGLNLLADYEAVRQQSTTNAGTGGFDIAVNGRTHLKGGAITTEGAASASTLTTQTLCTRRWGNNDPQEAVTTTTKQPNPSKGQRPARRTVIKVVVAIALVAGLLAWLHHWLRWPSDLEVHNQLSALTDSQAVKMAMLADIARYDDAPTVPKTYRLESAFEPPCLLRRAEIRTPENLISTRTWVYVFLRRHGVDERREPVGAVGVIVDADALGFERFNPRIFPTRRYVTDEIYKFGSPERVTYVGECPP